MSIFVSFSIIVVIACSLVTMLENHDFYSGDFN